MTFARLTDEQEAIRDAVREFAQKEIAPHADQWDEEHSFPREIFRPMAEMGLAGLLAPEEYGGSQLPRLTGALIYEELGKADMGTAVWLSVHNMVTGIISRYGDEEQRARWIPRLASGETLGAFSLSEAHAGSDAANLQCAARRDGDCYILNGSKFWVTNAGVADLYVVFARTAARGRAASRLSSSNWGRRALASASWSARWVCAPRRPASCSSISAKFPPRTGSAPRARD